MTLGRGSNTGLSTFQRVKNVRLAHPSGSLEHLAVDDPQLLLLQAVLQVFGPAGVVDEDGEEDHGRLQEEVQRGPEVEEEEGEGGDQDGGDLARQHVEHVVPELQDERHRQAQGGCGGREGGREGEEFLRGRA